MDTNSISQLIRMKRKEKGMTQTELAHAAGLSLPSITKYESGERIPKLDTLLKLDKVLDLGVTSKIPIELLSPLPGKEKNTELPQIKELLLKEDFSFLPQEEIDDLSNEIDKDLDEYCHHVVGAGGGDGRMIENEKKITHKIFDDIMALYDNQPIFDIVKLLVGYLSLNCEGEKLVLDFLKSCSDTPSLVQKNYDPSNRRPIECRRPEQIRRQFLQQ